MKKKNYYLFFIIICGLLLNGCFVSSTEQQGTSTQVETKKKKEAAVLQSENELNGVWVNQECIDKLKKYFSITGALEGYDFYTSLSFENNRESGAKFYGEMESDRGMVLDNALLIDTNTFHIEKVSETKILVRAGNKTYPFIKLKNQGYKNSFSGEEYLFSYLLFGTYRLKDNYNNKWYTITFNELNKVKGFGDYTYYYPSSYLNQDIIYFRKENKEQHFFIIQKSMKGFILTEVENFEWGEQSLVKTGREFSLEKIK